MAATNKVTTEPPQHWTREGTDLYLRQADRLEAINGPFGAAMLDAARLQPGDNVLDVGCGHGTTAIEAARRVAPDGACVGVDISPPLIDSARERAAEARADNVEFLTADAQLHPFPEAAFDAVISRFGIMFFDDPETAFANLGRAARLGGRLAVVCPNDPLQSEWVTIAFGAAAPHVGLPDVGPSGAPGPFAFADGDRLERTIRAGGFHEISLEPITRPIRMGSDIDDVTAFITSLPESQRLFSGKPPANVAAAVAALREGFAPYARPDGVVVNGSAWLALALR